MKLVLSFPTSLFHQQVGMPNSPWEGRVPDVRVVEGWWFTHGGRLKYPVDKRVQLSCNLVILGICTLVHVVRLIHPLR